VVISAFHQFGELAFSHQKIEIGHPASGAAAQKKRIAANFCQRRPPALQAATLLQTSTAFGPSLGGEILHLSQAQLFGHGIPSVHGQLRFIGDLLR
jgi:hypothetical protein